LPESLHVFLLLLLLTRRPSWLEQTHQCDGKNQQHAQQHHTKQEPQIEVEVEAFAEAAEQESFD
jgi:hypothetical protein